ncbi:MAG: hypothetical protein QOK43_1722 [Acidimicrobiaceae bacterium]|nr:hypothetical protein [Acidimicrobiaceae bacterium]
MTPDDEVDAAASVHAAASDRAADRADAATLYDDVLRRLDLARDRVRSLPASDEVKVALRARVERLADRAKADLTRASRRVDSLLEELASGADDHVDPS